MVSIRLTSLAMGTQLIVLLYVCGAASSASAARQPAVQLSACDRKDCFFHHQQPRGHDQSRGQLGYAAAPLQGHSTGAAEADTQNVEQQHGSSNRRQLMQTQKTKALPAISHPALEQWLQDSRKYTQRFEKGSCFADYPGFIAKDITGLPRVCMVLPSCMACIGAQSTRHCADMQLEVLQRCAACSLGNMLQTHTHLMHTYQAMVPTKHSYVHATAAPLSCSSDMSAHTATPALHDVSCTCRSCASAEGPCRHAHRVERGHCVHT